MSGNLYVYVDGESHFYQSQAAWKKLHGGEAELEDIVPQPLTTGGLQYPDSKTPFIRLYREGKFFWDTLYPFLVHQRTIVVVIDGGIYFTDYSGDDLNLHDVRVNIRRQGFDPQVIKENGKLARHREHWLATQGILEKPKGVDIGLTVRLLEDAYRNIFDICYLFTSDVDYMPVIQAMQRMGKKVVVFGYKDGLGANSNLEYGPDAFIELGEYMKTYKFQKAES